MTVAHSQGYRRVHMFAPCWIRVGSKTVPYAVRMSIQFSYCKKTRAIRMPCYRGNEKNKTKATDCRCLCHFLPFKLFMITLGLNCNTLLFELSRSFRHWGTALLQLSTTASVKLAESAGKHFRRHWNRASPDLHRVPVIVPWPSPLIKVVKWPPRVAMTRCYRDEQFPQQWPLDSLAVISLLFVNRAASSHTLQVLWSWNKFSQWFVGLDNFVTSWNKFVNSSCGVFHWLFPGSPVAAQSSMLIFISVLTW